jgi:hypothetical protein
MEEIGQERSLDREKIGQTAPQGRGRSMGVELR